MKGLATCSALLALDSQVSSHCKECRLTSSTLNLTPVTDIFQTFTANGMTNASYTHIRKNADYNSPLNCFGHIISGGILSRCPERNAELIK